MIRYSGLAPRSFLHAHSLCPCYQNNYAQFARKYNFWHHNSSLLRPEVTSMKIAVPVWDGSVSPVLDTARRLRVFDIENGVVVKTSEVPVDGYESREMAKQVAGHARALICGALSNQLFSHLSNLGITVYPWLMGDVEQLIDIVAAGRIPGPEYTMPGCHGQHRKQRMQGSCGRQGRGRNVCRGNRQPSKETSTNGGMTGL